MILWLKNLGIGLVVIASLLAGLAGVLIAANLLGGAGRSALWVGLGSFGFALAYGTIGLLLVNRAYKWHDAPPWARRRRPNTGTHDSLVEQIVARIRTWERPLDEFSELESAELSFVDGTKGLVILWTQDNDQGVRHFGLLVTADELAICDEGDVDTLLADLRLMVMEPHATEADESTRTWFRSFGPFATLP